MAVQVYNVPVILPDLRREESYQQIVDALEYLDAVANDIFNRISCRVADSRDQLTSINNRINVAQAKIDKLRSSSSRATRVFSSPKYPAPEKVIEHETIYQNVSPMLQKVKRTKTEIESRLIEVTPAIIKSKKEPFIFNPRQKRETREAVLRNDLGQGEGLGSLPRHLPSVSSLLLFNTDENPYKKYVLLDPLSGVKTKTRDKIIEEESGLSEAPVTITHGEELSRGPQDSLMYVPIMLELPELDVPELLPHLHQVATDMLYTADIGASIAPSLANTVVPELPNLADPEAPAANEPIPPPSSQPQPGTGGPPPPPPPTPPPPPPAEPPPPPPPQPESSDDEGGPLDESGDGRADLMAAIRKAGGASKAGLKSVKNKKHERKAHKKEVEAAAEEGDLLSDLSAALTRRRKAMSGKEKEERREERRDEQPHNLGGGSMMDNISRMIPPPSAMGRDDGKGHESDEVDW